MPLNGQNIFYEFTRIFAITGFWSSFTRNYVKLYTQFSSTATPEHQSTSDIGGVWGVWLLSLGSSSYKTEQSHDSAWRSDESDKHGGPNVLGKSPSPMKIFF